MLYVTLSETRTPDSVRRCAVIAGKEVWWEITGPSDALPLPLTVHDMAVTAFTNFAMHRGEDLHINGPVSESMLESVEGLVASWVNLRPDLYQRIKVTADTEIPDSALPVPPRHTAIVAFSGGLDASFTTWRHFTGRAGRRSRNLFAGVLVQGLDMPLCADQAFANACGNAKQTLNSINRPLMAVKTNWRDEVCTEWVMEFGTAVTTCLRIWQGLVDTALVGSDEDYSRLVMPLGGNPLTFAMLSSSGFTVIYDGAEFARTEKAGGISDWEMGMRNLRVCWQGPLTGYNCGICEKCLRTKMNFLASGAPLPPALAGMPTISQILGIRVRINFQIVLLNEVYEIAMKNGIKAPWLNALRWTIAKNSLMNGLPSPLVHLWGVLKNSVISLFNTSKTTDAKSGH